jgi:hypothetical protein
VAPSPSSIGKDEATMLILQPLRIFFLQLIVQSDRNIVASFHIAILTKLSPTIYHTLFIFENLTVPLLIVSKCFSAQ